MAKTRLRDMYTTEVPEGIGHMTVFAGNPGAGKSTLLSHVVRSMGFDLEGGMTSKDFAGYPVVRGISTVMELEERIREFVTADDRGEFFDAICIDSLTEVQRMMTKEVLSTFRKDTLNACPFGRGRELLGQKMEDFLRKLKKVNGLGISVYLVAHTTTTRVDPPDDDSYTKFELDLDKSVLPYVVHTADNILLLRQETHVSEKDGRHVAKGSGRRYFCTQERPAWTAKNRCGMPEKIDATWEALSPYLGGKK